MFRFVLILFCISIGFLSVSGQNNNTKKEQIDEKPFYASSLPDDYFIQKHLLFRTSIFENGVAFEWPFKPVKFMMRQISLGFRHDNPAKNCFLIPTIMPQYLDYCRTNQFKGLNFKYEKKYYSNNERNVFFSLIAETGMYWTPSGTNVRKLYTWDSDPIPYYDIHQLYTLRLGYSAGFGRSDEYIEFGIYLGGQMHYYDLTYELTQGNYYVHPTGEIIRETGIRFWPTVRFIFAIKIF